MQHTKCSNADCKIKETCLRWVSEAKANQRIAHFDPYMMKGEWDCVFLLRLKK